MRYDLLRWVGFLHDNPLAEKLFQDGCGLVTTKEWGLGCLWV